MSRYVFDIRRHTMPVVSMLQSYFTPAKVEVEKKVAKNVGSLF